MATKDEDAVTNLFVTSTHTPVLFFSTAGKVYRLKVWRLPEGAPQARGRPMVNLLPLGEGETISTVLPLPEDEAEWGKLHIVFATAHGAVRRNSMDAFTNIPTAGKIAMRFGESDAARRSDRPADRGLAAHRGGRRPARHPQRQGDPLRGDRRSASSRAAPSTGVRGIALQGDDEVISLSILKGFEATHRGARGLSSRRALEGTQGGQRGRSRR